MSKYSPTRTFISLTFSPIYRQSRLTNFFEQNLYLIDCMLGRNLKHMDHSLIGKTICTPGSSSFFNWLLCLTQALRRGSLFRAIMRMSTCSYRNGISKQQVTVTRAKRWVSVAFPLFDDMYSSAIPLALMEGDCKKQQHEDCPYIFFSDRGLLKTPSSLLFYTL